MMMLGMDCSPGGLFVAMLLPADSTSQDLGLFAVRILLHLGRRRLFLLTLLLDEQFRRLGNSQSYGATVSSSVLLDPGATFCKEGERLVLRVHGRVFETEDQV